MNQVSDILHLAKTAVNEGTDAVLATVVKTEGSAYRQVGAMMLICEDGRSVGMISGGCLEPHIIKKAFWLTKDGATVQIYQTGDSDDEDEADEALNFGLGCNGRVHVLFERLNDAAPLLALIDRVRQSQLPQTIASVIDLNTPELTIGTRFCLDDLSQNQLTDIQGKTQFTKDKLLTRLADFNSQNLTKKPFAHYEDDKTTWLIQNIKPQIRLLVCGAGNDVMPLVTLAKMQDWHVTVIDSRVHYATKLRFSAADDVRCVPLDDSETLLNLSKNALVAVMSHSLSQDRARLSVLLANPTHYHYLGQLGPKYRTERLIDEILSASSNPEIFNQGIKKLHFPIGFKLGGDGPEALALGIMAQMSAVIHHGDLKSKDGLGI
ncbi:MULTISPECIES: XdhC family protein [Psychrobacter]|uniref:XdhC family protein n=1 Tax=Psychrobacter TaxID=497 RepID=UPI00146E9BC0|nr:MULTISPECIES: XdhC/CoxI family protein [Psychrobacter]